jgi:chromosome segregation ATPase
MMENIKTDNKKYTTRVDRLKRSADNRNSEIEELESRLEELRRKKQEVDRKVEEAAKKRTEWELKTNAARENKFKYQLGGYFLNYIKNMNNREAVLNTIYKTLQNNKEKKVFIEMCKKIYSVAIVDNSIFPRGAAAQVDANEVRTERDSARELSRSDIDEIEKIVFYLTEYGRFESASQKQLFNHLVDGLPDGLGDTYWQYSDLPA